MYLQKSDSLIIFLLTLFFQYFIIEGKFDDTDKEIISDKFNYLLITYIIEIIIYLSLIDFDTNMALVIEFVIFILTII